MFCPDCGMENANNQKFCRRCGTNLIALERARAVITEISTGAPQQIEPRTVLRILAFVASFGFAAVTTAMIVLSMIQYIDAPPDSPRWNDPPMGIIAGLFGYTALVLICRQLLSLLKHAPAAPVALPQTLARASITAPPPSLLIDTNRSLSAAPAYQSIIEEDTKTFTQQPQSR
jgi:hypothetical protein